METNKISPWIVTINDIGQISISSKIGNTLPASGKKYADRAYKNLPQGYLNTFYEGFYIENKGKQYYLVLTRDALSSGGMTTDSNVEVVVVQTSQKLICSSQSLDCNNVFRVVQSWKFSPKSK